jgi:urease gamma subunit
MKQKDPLLREVFGMIAVREMRQQDTFAKSKKTSYTGVLKHLQIVSSVSDPNAQADRMWEKLFELALFVRSGGKHRKPTEILKTFIKAPGEQLKKLSKEEKKKLSEVFDFLKTAYKDGLAESRLATDQTHFYTMATALLSSDLLNTIKDGDLISRFIQFGKVVDGKEKVTKNLSAAMKIYQEVSAKQTTDVSRRETRQKEFLTIIRGLGIDNGGKKHGSSRITVSKIRQGDEETINRVPTGDAEEGEDLPGDTSQEEAG